MQFSTQYRYRKPLEQRCEVVSDVILTVPDMSLTVQEMMEKFVRGVNLPVGKDPQFDENPNFDDIPVEYQPGVDIVDIYDEIERVNTNIESAKRRRTAKDSEANVAVNQNVVQIDESNTFDNDSK